MADHWFFSTHFKLITCAVDSLDFGAVFCHKWFAEVWPTVLTAYDITINELFPIVLALKL